LQALLERLELPRTTYYDQRNRMKRPDKYADEKDFIEKVFHRSRETYSYRRIHAMAAKAGFHLCAETVRRLMSVQGLKVQVYSKHTSSYSSYKGKVGRIAPNIIKQVFSEVKPLTVFHTDITQIKLVNNQWGYLSCITDEASGEVVVAEVSASPGMQLIRDTLDGLASHINSESKPILHSDQGWQYQQKVYRQRLKNLNIKQSMSRKGNCHDNAPIESFFNLMKRECLNRIRIKNIEELTKIVSDYTYWFNNERISMNKNDLTPVEYRNQAIAV
jgi:putative transposase